MGVRRCDWCLSPLVAGRCTHCGRQDAGRAASLPEGLAARVAARRQQLARARQAQAVPVRQGAMRPRWRRWLPWAASGGLLAAAALYASTSGLLPALPLSWRTGCDICGMYVLEHGADCERFLIDSDRADRARYVNACAVQRTARAAPWGFAEHVYRVHRREDGSFWLAPAAAGNEYGPVTFTPVPGTADRWRSDAPAMFRGSAAGLFRRSVAAER